MQINIEYLAKELINSKLETLWYSVNHKLSPIERDFKNRLNAYFSQQQKQVIHNIKQDNSELLDYDKYIDKLVNLYLDNINKLFNIAQKRVEAESNKIIDENLKQQLSNIYTLKYIHSIANDIVNTTKKHLDLLHSQYKQNKITKEEFIDKVNEYFNNECKKHRSKLISTTETYRVYNFAYLNMMASLGYIYKMYVAKPNTTCPVCSKLHKQTKFILEDFDTSMIDRKDLIENTLFPPIHAQSHSILLCLK